MIKPIRVMASGLTNRIWAVRRYTENQYSGLIVSSAKDDVTAEALRAAVEHIKNGCTLSDCPCQFLTLHSQCGRIYPVPEPGQVVRACILSPRHDGKHSDFEVDW